MQGNRTADLDGYREHLVRNVKFDREQIRSAALAMADRLQSIARQMERADDPIISGLGELQGQGPIFDTYCARYAADRQALKDFDSFMAENDDA